MKIGIVTTWFESGAGHVSMQYKKALELAGNHVFIFARGSYYPLDDPYFNVPNVFWSNPMHTPEGKVFSLKEFENWIDTNNLEVVFFNEEKWLMPLVKCAEKGIKTGAYIDYYKEDTVRLFDVYDFVICNTKRHFSVFNQHPQAFYIPWGTETEVYTSKTTDLVNSECVTFFHSCATTPQRKGTDVVLKAFLKLKSKARLIIHSQIDPFENLRLPQSEYRYLLENGALQIIRKTAGAPGLYCLGDVYVYPSRLEGIGLSIAEAISSGLGLITTDNPPMIEFLDPSFGMPVRVQSFAIRKDNYYWPMSEPDVNDLADKMQLVADNKEMVMKWKRNARKYADENLNWYSHSEELNQIFKITVFRSDARKSEGIKLIKNLKPSFRWSSVIYKIWPALYSFIYGEHEKRKQKRLQKIQQKNTD